MKQKSEIPGRLVIKKTKFGEDDYYYILVLFFAVIAIIFEMKDIMIKMILLTFISVFVFYIIKRRLNDNNCQT